LLDRENTGHDVRIGMSHVRADIADHREGAEVRAPKSTRVLASTAVPGLISPVLLSVSSPAGASEETVRWEPGTPPLSTPWTDDVGPDNALPEYPRPQLVRSAWRNLNGVWQFAAAEEGEEPPIGRDL